MRGRATKMENEPIDLSVEGSALIAFLSVGIKNSRVMLFLHESWNLESIIYTLL
jgi:hypothetical protein